jgi:hypothetical protein
MIVVQREVDGGKQILQKQQQTIREASIFAVLKFVDMRGAYRSDSWAYIISGCDIVELKPTFYS